MNEIIEQIKSIAGVESIHSAGDSTIVVVINKNRLK
jgi:hypothetical protein